MSESVVKSNRAAWQLVLIAMVFITPIVAAFLWQPTGYVNHGELVEPPRPLRDVALARLDGSLFKLSELGNKWTLMYVGGDRCTERCEQSLYKIQQVRLAQSKNAYRVQSVFVVPTDGRDAMLEQLDRFNGMIGLTAAPEELGKLARQLSISEQETGAGPRIFVIDPLGNYMMSYSADADPNGIRKDLVRLLKVSQVG